MKKTREKAIILLLVAFLAVMLAGIIFPALPHVVGNAAENYSPVLDDLQKDKTFNASAYPAKKKDYSLQVIQIAESTGGEVLVYVYQPCAMTKQLKATSINVSTTIGENLNYKNYQLTYLNGSGVFAKYKVNELSVKADIVRYYDISSIFRAWEAELDEPAAGATANGNEITEVSFPVGKLYTASTLEGKVSYSLLETETITIINKYCGFVRYMGGWAPFGIQFDCDSWYVAFSTDKKIDRLMEADLYYLSQHYLKGITETYGEEKENYTTLKYSDKAESTATGAFTHVYKWQRIESVKDFTEKEKLNEETKKGLQGMQWVLRFTETKVTIDNAFGNRTEAGMRVNEVTILRLKFETNGQVYNLGVVDNMQSAGLIPDNLRSDGLEWWQILLIIIAVILALILLCAFIKPFAEIVLFLLKGVWFIVTLPFRLIGAIFTNKKN